MSEPTALDIEEQVLKMRADIQQQYTQQARSRASIVGHKKAIEQEGVNLEAADRAIQVLHERLASYISEHGDPTAGSL